MNANGTHKPRRPETPRTSLLNVLWRGPLFAIPFALFFGMLMGGSWAALVGVYKVSLVFTYMNGLLTWAVRWFVIPALGRGDTQLARSAPYSFIAFMIVLFVGSSFATGLANRTNAGSPIFERNSVVFEYGIKHFNIRGCHNLGDDLERTEI